MMIKLTALAAVLALSACSQPSIQPGDGPAQTDPPVASEPVPYDPPVAFNQKYVYEDGLEVEVVRVKASRFTAADVASTDDQAMKRKPYVKFTIRFRNGTPKQIKMYGADSANYGPDGIQAEPTYLLDDSEFDGKLLAGKRRTAESVYLIPEKYWDDVILEVSPDLDHESAVFSGSVR